MNQTDFRYSLLVYGAALGLCTLAACHPQVETARGVTMFRGVDYTAYQADSVRTYFSYWFPAALMGGDSIAPHIRYYHQQLETLGSLFSDGTLSGEMFLRVMRDTSEYERTSVTNRFGTLPSTFRDSLGRELLTYNGPLIKILMSDVNTAASPTRVHIRATTSKWEDGWGSMLLFSFDLVGREILHFRYDGMEL
jgi:hypothetical protein